MKRHSGRRLIFWYLVRIFCKNAREAASGSFFQMHGNQKQCFFTSLHSKKPAIHNFLLYSRISYYFSNGIQFRIFIIKMTIYSLFTINLTVIPIIFNSIFPQEIFKILNLPAVNDPLQYLFIHFHFILSYKTKVCHNRICRIPSTALHFSILQCQNIQQFLYIHLSLKATTTYAVSDDTSDCRSSPSLLSAM